jgi:hypothetical protein
MPMLCQIGQFKLTQNCVCRQTILVGLKVHEIENFFDSDFGICVISLLVMHI